MGSPQIQNLWGEREPGENSYEQFIVHRIEPELARSDSGGIRTRDPQLRRLLLYPTELPNPCASTARKKRAKVLLFFQLRKKNRTFTAFYVLFFTKGHQKVVPNPVFCTLQHDD